MKNKYILLVLVLFVSNIFAQNEFDSLIKKLSDGNSRFVSSQMIHPNISDIRRDETAQGQNPFAVVVSCSDSRVPPEIIFDQGLGDLFVIRTAGEVVDDVALASIEYAVEHLGVKLIIVMGHQKCGAVDAAVKGGELGGHLRVLADAISPAVDAAKKETGDLLDTAIHKNVELIVGQLKDSMPILQEYVHGNKLKIVGAYYNLSDGLVTFLN